MTAPGLRIIVSGYIAQYPLGGVTWDYLQYAIGLARAGHDVFYIEDTGQWPYDPREGGTARAADFNVSYLAGTMERFGFGDRWAYRFPWHHEWYGMPEQVRNNVIRTADLVINVSGAASSPDLLRGRGRLAYIDSDPVFTQVKLVRGQADFQQMVDAHDVHFSFGESMGPGIPDTGHRWIPTRQPVVLDEWAPTGDPRPVFTTVMNWTSYRPVVYDGRTYGQKDVELRRFMDLPGRVAPTQLELAVNHGKTARTPHDLLRHKGWALVDPEVSCGNLDEYRGYITSSMAEWSVAKNGYVVGQSGWFSCRSACYLAAGRPVVVQDTGFRGILPTGEGLLAFSDIDEAVAGIREVESNYSKHSKAARAIAEEYFDSGRVLSTLIDDVFSDVPGAPVVA